MRSLDIRKANTNNNICSERFIRIVIKVIKEYVFKDKKSKKIYISTLYNIIYIIINKKMINQFEIMIFS